MRQDQRSELVRAAYEVAIDVSPAAFRKGASQHYVGRAQLRRLLAALSPVLLHPSFPAAEIDERLDAIRQADADRMKRHAADVKTKPGKS